MTKGEIIFVIALVMVVVTLLYGFNVPGQSRSARLQHCGDELAQVNARIDADRHDLEFQHTRIGEIRDEIDQIQKQPSQ